MIELSALRDAGVLSLVLSFGIIIGWISMLLLLAVFIPRRAPEGLAPDAAGPVRAQLVREEVPHA